jgi:hypothetical protein
MPLMAASSQPSGPCCAKSAVVGYGGNSLAIAFTTGNNVTLKPIILFLLPYESA